MTKSANREELFILKLNQIILNNLTNEQFSVEKLAEIYGISRSQLHKKLKKALGKSVSQFIREIRLEEAMKMLKQDRLTVSEIAYQVGFSSPAYFNTCFKETYGYPPGEVKFRKHLDKGLTPEKRRSVPFFSKFKKRKIIFLIVSVALLILFTLSFLTINRTSSKGNSTLDEPLATDSMSQEKTIAVLPLKNWSGDPELEYISDGMTDAIIIRLAKIESIRKVVSFTSMLSYKNTDKSISQIAQELGVKNVLQGSFQLSGEDVSIKLQMIDATSENQFWENEYNSIWNSDEIFVMQAEVAENVARNMQVEITDQEIAVIQKFPTKNKEAYNLYLQAEYLKSKHDAYTYENAIRLYENAIALDPKFLEAYVGLANTFIYGGLFWGVFNEQEAWRKGKPLLQKALAIDSMNIQVHEQLFTGSYYYDWNFDLSEAYYQGKLFGDRKNFAFYYAINTGRSDEALIAIENSIDLDPSDRFLYVAKAEALFFLGNMEESSAILETYNSYFIDNFYYLIQTARLYYNLGEHEKAKKHLQLILDKFQGRPPIVLWLEVVYQEMDGNTAGVKETLKLLHKKYEEKVSGSPAWFLALYYAHIKDYDKALLWLQNSYDHHEVEMVWLKEEPVLEFLREDQRYWELYKKVGFSKVDL